MTLTSALTYGKTNAEELLLGRGILRLDFYDDTGNATGAFFDMGDIAAFNMNIDEQTLEHQSSREGLAFTDASVTLSKTLSGSFTMEEFGAKQLSTYLSGKVTEAEYSLAPGLVTGVDNCIIPADVGDGTSAGHMFQVFTIAGTSGKRVYSVVAGTLDVTGYSEGAAYEVDEDMGMIRVVPGGALDDAIQLVGTGNSLTLNVNYELTQNTDIQEVAIFEKTSVRAGLMFVGENAVNGKKREVMLFSCKLTASGDANFLADEYGQMEINFTAESVTNSPKGWTAASSWTGSSAKVGTIRQIFPTTP